MLSFADGFPGGSRPSSHGSGVVPLGPTQPTSGAAPEAGQAADGAAACQAAAAIFGPVPAAAGPQLAADAQADAGAGRLSQANADVATPASTGANPSGQLGGPQRLTQAENTSTIGPVLGDSPVQPEPILDSPAHSDAATVQAILPAAYLLDGLLEGSGETSGNLAAAALPRGSKKFSLGGAAPPSTVTAPAGPSAGPRSAGLRREKSATGAAACTPRSGQTGATPASAGTARKAAGASNPAQRQTTPASSARPLSSTKPSQPRAAAKASAAAATTTPGRQSSQKPRRPSTAAAADAARETAPLAADRTTPPRSAIAVGTAVQPAAGNTGGTPVADGELLAGVATLGAGTPFFLKRTRPAAGTTPPITPFSNMKCPPVSARGAGSTPPALVVPAAVAAAAAAAPTALPPGKAQAPAQQRVKRVARPKAPAAATLAKAPEPDAKAGQTSKAAAAGRNNAAGGGDGAAIRRNSSSGGPAKAAAGAKPAAPPAVPAAAKALAAAAGRTGAAHAVKPAAAGPAAAHKKEPTAKQAAGKHVAEAGAAKAVHVDTDPGLEGHAAEPQVKLGRAGSAGGAGVSGAAAGRYGNSQSIASDSIGAALAAARQAACHSPDKLPPSKRYAVPVMSPSKRPRQERAPSAPPVVPLPLSAPAAAARGGAAAAGRAGGRGRSTRRPASSPAMRAALAAKSARSLSANARRPRSSLPCTAPEQAPAPSYSPMQITPGGSARKALPAAAAAAAPAAADPESPLAHQVPMLNFDGIASGKSPMGTQNLRPPSAAVAADIMPLRRQPVGAVRSPVLFGAAASARRLGGVSPGGGPGSLSPAPVAADAVDAGARRSPAIAKPAKQPASGSVALPSARGHALDGPRTARGHQSGDDATLGGLLKAKAAKNDHGAARASAAAAGAGGDGARPLTARPGDGAQAAPATKAAPAVQRSASARPGAVHKPVMTTAAGGAAAPKPAAAAVTAAAATNGAGAAAATAGILKAGAATGLAAAGTIKPAKAAAGVAAAAAATAAPKAKQPPLRGSGGPSDAAQHPSRAPEPPAPAAVAEDRRNSARHAPRGPTGAAAAAAARPEPLARGARQDPEQERAQRRRQYEALLGRSGSASHSQDAAPAAAAPEEAAATAAAPPAGKPAAKPAGLSASSQPERAAAARKAPVPHYTAQPAHVGQPRAVARQPAPQPQRGKAAATTAKHAAAGPAAPAPAAAAAGGAASKAVDGAGHRGRTSSDAHAGATPDTVQGLSPQDGLPGMPALALSTAAPEEVVAAEMGSLTLEDAGVQEPGAEDGGAGGGERRASPQEEAEEQGATPKRPPDLSWLMDASPSASLAVTPGALAPTGGFGMDAPGFGFGDLSADGSASGRVDTAPSTGFLGFGASAGDLQPQLAPASTCTLEGPGGEVVADDAAFGTGLGDATVVVNKQLPPLAVHPMGLPPTGLAPGGLSGGGGAAAAVPSSTFTNKTLGVGLLTPGPGQVKLPGPATNRAKAAGPAPAALRQAKLRFSWDPTATPVVPVQPGAYACPTPGMAADSFMGFGAIAAVGHEATPTSLPHPLPGGGFGASGGLDSHRQQHVAAAAALGCRPDGIAIGALNIPDMDAAMDQELSAEVPVPVQCTSPNTPAMDAFGGVVLGAGAADQGGVPLFGGAAGGLGRAGRAVQDSFDALRISSMSSWPIMRERESERV